MATLQKVNEVLSISQDNKVFQFGDTLIDLVKEGANNKKMVSDNIYYRINLYNKEQDTTPDNELSPLPDPQSGKQYLFNKKKTEFGSKAGFITNMTDASALPEREWGVLMGVSTRFFPMLPYEILTLLDKINYKLVILNNDDNKSIEMPLLDINQFVSLNSSLPNGGKAHASVIKTDPTKLDPSRWLLLKPSTSFEVYIEPENYELTKELPTPNKDNGIRFHLMVKLHGLFTKVKGYY